MWNTLEYWYADERHVVFNKYEISDDGQIRNSKTLNILRQRITKRGKGYHVINVVDDDGITQTIRVARAVCCSFLGKPPTNLHTADHKDRMKENNTVANLRWYDKSGQSNNQTRNDTKKTALLVSHNGEDKTVKEWATVLNTDRDQIYRWINTNEDFSYKIYEDLEGEIWKIVPGADNKRGHWEVSNMCRVALHTANARRVLNADEMNTDGSYPCIKTNGKSIGAHVAVFMVFFPDEYNNKSREEIVCHKNDIPIDFSPDNLYLGNKSANGKDAHDNGCHDGTMRERKPCVATKGDTRHSFLSISDAADWIKITTRFTNASSQNISAKIDKIRADGLLRTAYGYVWTSS
jgi:hypothetical protein